MKIEANGIRINYELSGKKDAPVVVLSHSLACSMVMWDPQLDLLEAHFRVLRFDTRGTGIVMRPRNLIRWNSWLMMPSLFWMGWILTGSIGSDCPWAV
jgi:pimeloyl-ACP methyl ester carboxylesterase